MNTNTGLDSRVAPASGYQGRNLVISGHSRPTKLWYRGITPKLITLTLLCCTCVYLVPACSTGKPLTVFSDIRGTVESQSPMTDENLWRLMSQLRPHPGNAEAHYQLGYWYQERSRHQEAIKEFKKAIYIKPNYTEAYNGLGVSYDWQGDYAAASDAYRMALKLNPNLGHIYNNLGYACILQGKNAEAVETLKQAIALGCDNKQTHNNLGLAYGLSGQIELAMQEFEHTGSKAFAHTLVAKIYYDKGQFDEAKEQYAKALELDPDSALSQKGFEVSALLNRFGAVLTEVKRMVAMPGRPAKTETSRDASQSFANVNMEVSNGNGVDHMAKNIARYLKEQGFMVVRLTNADNFGYRETTLLYRPEYAEATRELAEHLPGIPTLKEVKKLDRPDVGIKMVLGRDLAPTKALLQGRKSDENFN
jgi:Flp pilus assembly protein TadD